MSSSTSTGTRADAQIIGHDAAREFYIANGSDADAKVHSGKLAYPPNPYEHTENRAPFTSLYCGWNYGWNSYYPEEWIQEDIKREKEELRQKRSWAVNLKQSLK